MADTTGTQRISENLMCAETLMEYIAVFVLICRKMLNKDTRKYEVQYERDAQSSL